jgi:amphi-Trp domain-containing protein
MAQSCLGFGSYASLSCQIQTWICLFQQNVGCLTPMLRVAYKSLFSNLPRAGFPLSTPSRLFSDSSSSFDASEDRDVTVSRGNKQAIALLRRVALAMESGKSWRTSVDKKVLVVPKTAEFSVEHESEGDEHCLELQFKWVTDSAKARARKSEQ